MSGSGRRWRPPDTPLAAAAVLFFFLLLAVAHVPHSPHRSLRLQIRLRGLLPRATKSSHSAQGPAGVAPLTTPRSPVWLLTPTALPSAPALTARGPHPLRHAAPGILAHAAAAALGALALCAAVGRWSAAAAGPSVPAPTSLMAMTAELAAKVDSPDSRERSRRKVPELRHKVGDDVTATLDAMAERRTPVTEGELNLMLDMALDAELPVQWNERVLQRLIGATADQLGVDATRRLQAHFAADPAYESHLVPLYPGGRFSAGEVVYTLKPLTLTNEEVVGLQTAIGVLLRPFYGERLREWLVPRIRRFDVIIDGASIGSAGQLRDNPRALSVGQIQAAMDAAAAKLGCRRPLVLLPSRFTTERPAASRPWLDRHYKAVYATPKSKKVDWSAAYAALLADVPYVTGDPQADLKEELKDFPAFGVWQATHRVRCEVAMGQQARLIPAATYTACVQAFDGGWMVPTHGPEWLQIRRRA